MRQRDTLVARAIVSAEIMLLGADNGGRGAATPPPTLTVHSIVDKYGLDWGEYVGKRQTIPRADQLIRNALSAEFIAGRIVAHERHGHYVAWKLA